MESLLALDRIACCWKIRRCCHLATGLAEAWGTTCLAAAPLLIEVSHVLLTVAVPGPGFPEGLVRCGPWMVSLPVECLGKS